MISLQQGKLQGELIQKWWIEAHNENSVEPTSKQKGMYIYDLEKELPPLIYERYCMLKMIPPDEYVSGIGKVVRYNNGACQFFIYEEE